MTVRRPTKFTIMAAIGFVFFAIVWWIAEGWAHFDRNSALTIAGFMSGPLLAGLSVWAGERRPADRSALPVASDAAWPEPRTVKTTRDFYALLTSTWIRAGSPTVAEVERRTGGRVQNLGGLLDYDDGFGASPYPYGLSSSEVDWPATLLLLESFGLPRNLIGEWKGAAVRAQRFRPRQYRFDKRAEYVRRWRLTAAVASGTFLALYTAVGMAASQLTAAHLGLGNHVALFVTSIILLAVTGFSLSRMYWHGRTVRGAVLACCNIGFAAGFAVAFLKVGSGASINYAHIGLLICNWLAWRF